MATNNITVQQLEEAINSVIGTDTNDRFKRAGCSLMMRLNVAMKEAFMYHTGDSNSREVIRKAAIIVDKGGKLEQ